MKTISKFATVGVLALGFLGCADNNDKGSLLNSDGTKGAAGHTAPGAIKDSKAFAEQAKSNSPTESPEYREAMKKK